MIMNKKIIAITASIIFLIVSSLFFIRSSIGRDTRRGIEATIAHMSSDKLVRFPDINESELSATQQKIIQISRVEYAKKPVSYDETVLKYSNGVREPWCADYVSWIMREAGVPLVNPNSGGWRIPGVLTLKEYYKKNNRFRDAAGYTPKAGDVAIYVNTSSFNTSRQHTSVVLKVEGDQVTTIGGNEHGRLRITTQKLVLGTKGLVGYGMLSQ